MADIPERQELIMPLDKLGETKKALEKSNKQEVLEGQIFDLYCRGMSMGTIASICNVTKGVVLYYIKKAKKETYNNYYAKDRAGILGDALKRMERLEAQALISMSMTEEASAARLHWMEAAARRLKERIDFIRDFNLIGVEKQSNVEDMQKDVKKMPTTALQKRIEEIKSKFAGADIGSVEDYQEIAKLKDKIAMLEQQLSAQKGEIDIDDEDK